MEQRRWLKLSDTHNPDGINIPDLYTRLGSIEQQLRAQTVALEVISTQSTQNVGRFEKIELRCAERGSLLKQINDRVHALETNGLSKKKALQMNLTSLGAVLLALKEIVVTLLGAFK